MLKSVKAIIIISVMVSMTILLISSCGTNGPTSSQPSSKYNINSTKSGILSISFPSTNPLTQVTFSTKISEASGPVIISWNNYPQATYYKLYYSDTYDFTNAKIITNITSPYTVQITNPDKDYYFFITGIINGEEKKVSDEFISSTNGKIRYNIASSFDLGVLKRNLLHRLLYLRPL